VSASTPATRSQAVGLLLAVLGVVALATTLHAVGRDARRFLPDRRVISVRDGVEALEALRRAGVRGRVLLWLDRSLPLNGVPEASAAAFLRDPSAAPPGGEESVLYLAMRANLVRRVVYVVPDDRWEGYAAAARARPELYADGGGFVQFVEGVPVVSRRAREALALPAERAILYVTPGAREFFGARAVDELIANPALSDLVLVRR